ncbi:hypothetical protein [Spirosoma validum]|uniref:Uncharacterized protein n=1 Tax=Spirosoma validum TaxID=2771355 RepID=A0A927GGZ9_9BACT|nr:hypothetical protein [Spirosoma validum]MBD2757223.1 hypothetical protein [Spirosoma validum]
MLHIVFDHVGFDDASGIMQNTAADYFTLVYNKATAEQIYENLMKAKDSDEWPGL